MNITQEKNPMKGIGLCLIAYSFISLIGLSEKAISPAVPLSVILFFQNAICLLLILPGAFKQGLKVTQTQHINTYIIRILSGLGCYATLFYIIRLIPISEALLYQYSASLWIPFIMLAWLNVRMPKNLWYGILLGFAGLLFILKPDASLVGMVSFLGILCGILQAVSVIAIRILTLSEPTGRLLFYNFLVCTLIMLPLALMHGTVPSLHDSFFLVGVGLSSYLAQQFATIAFKYANATTLAPICYTSIVFTGILGWVFWQEVPETLTFLGMALVIVGCVLSLYMSNKNATLTNTESA